MDKYQLTAVQVDREIQQEDIPILAAYFDHVEHYVDVMELTPGEHHDVRRKGFNSNHLAMIECMKIWKRKMRSQATFKVLLKMLVMLKKEAIANQICQYLKVSVCVYRNIYVIGSVYVSALRVPILH